MKRLSIARKSFWGDSRDIYFPDDELISTRYKYNDFIIERDGEFVMKVTIGGKITVGETKVTSKISFRTIRFYSYFDNEILIRIGTKKLVCGSIDFDVFVGSNKIAYFRSVSISSFQAKEFVLLYKSVVDYKLAIFLLTYLTNESVDLF
jgi:hypothetical protein